MGSGDTESELPLNEVLTKSKQRVVDHGEVFTPSWVVGEMLDLVKDESYRIDSKFLEPACGSGNFLVQVLRRKIHTVKARYSKSEFETNHFGLLSLMCIYGIELLSDNATECRENLRHVFDQEFNFKTESVWSRAAKAILDVNIIEGDALTIKSTSGQPLVFPEWSYLGAGLFQRRDFLFDSLTQRSSIEGTLFELFEEEDIFVPLRTYEPARVEELAQ